MCDISKSYKKIKVLNEVNLAVERGHITGLLGPNGAGKTTLLKILAGLTSPDEGKLLFYGTEVNLDDSRRKMIFMLEEPIIDPLMTAEKNMKYVEMVKGISDTKAKIDETLKQVGLGNTGKKLAKDFSLGMKQRLGIAMALLSEPDVLVLDEPMNGLDPEGMAEMRSVLRELAEKKNVSIVISSHILSEVAELCTDYAIISKGRLLEAASMSEWRARSKRHVVLCTNDMEKTIALLKEQLAIFDYRVSEDNELLLYEFPEDIGCISKVLMKEGIFISKLACEGESLEEYYLTKVGGCCD